MEVALKGGFTGIECGSSCVMNEEKKNKERQG
jgi:hypothetical protein